MKTSYKYKISGLVLLIGVLIFIVPACSKNLETSQSQVQGYPIDSNVVTTLDRTVVPVSVPANSPKVLPHEIAKFAQYGYGLWQYGPGLGYEKRLDLMPPGYSSSTVQKAANLLHFFTITDVHLRDEETPAQKVYFGYNGGSSSAYSPSMRYTTQVFDAAVQTINALHRQSRFDFGIALGDAVNSSQYNELRWYLDILDGKKINPDSGIKDDPVPGPNNDYQDEFIAAGLDKSIPWYQTLGNHDHSWMGNYPVTDYIRPFYTGEKVLLLGDLATEGIDSRTTYMGAIDGRTPDGEMIGGGLIGDFKTPPTVPSDPDRRPLTRKEWMSEFVKTTANPPGHGFSQSNVDKDFACYTFEPKSDLPVKVIVLDDTQKDENFDIKEHGILDNERYNWLVSELDKGQAEGKLMIVSSHVPLTLIDYDHHSPVPLTALISKLHEYPNILLWTSGHAHRNTITALNSPDATHPELGFWQVETPSIRDYPQQFRTFDIVRNSDNTISIFATDVDPAVKEGSPAALSRSYTVAVDEIFTNNTVYFPPTGSYNAELVKQLSPEMQEKIKKYGTAPGK